MNQGGYFMKKTCLVLLSLIFALSIFTGCAAPAPAPAAPAAPAEPAAPAAPAAETSRLLMVTGGTSGTYYSYGGVLATILSENVPGLEITANTSGASAANARSLQNKEAELTIIQNDVLDYAYNGTEMLAEDGGMPTLRTIATLYPEVIQVVATVSSGITSVADFSGKRVCVGDAGSGTEANARQVLAAYGLTFDDIGTVENLSFADAATAMQNGTIDASFTTAGVPNPAISELKASTDIVLIPINGAEADKLIADYPFYSEFTITDEHYGFTGCETVAILATLACTDELNEELAYQMTKALFENKDAITAAHAKGEELSTESAVQGVSIPFHPGAERYYKEVGAIS